MVSRREFLATSGSALALAGLSSSAGAQSRSGRKRIALIATLWTYQSHAQHIGDRFLVGYPHQGGWHQPEMDIVSAYVGNNVIATGDLPALIQSIHRALSNIAGGAEPAEAAPKEPAVPIRRSITPDFLICLEDGRKFKSLKRHLRTKYNMSPEDYRAKWNLPKDYPMVAPNYARARSELAKQMGLGQGGRQATRKRR